MTKDIAVDIKDKPEQMDNKHMPSTKTQSTSTVIIVSVVMALIVFSIGFIFGRHVPSARGTDTDNTSFPQRGNGDFRSGGVNQQGPGMNGASESDDDGTDTVEPSI